jgi:hypothetical protein
MKLEIDWTYLRFPLLLLAAAAALAVALYLVGDWWSKNRGEDYRADRSGLRESYSDYRQALEEQQLMETYRKEFERLTTGGVIGEENRLTWVETIRDTNRILKLPEFQYAIEPQHPFARPGLERVRNIERRSSSMTLDLGLIHEGDLFAVFEGLRAGAKGLYSIESCELNRKTPWDKQPTASVANLTARCSLEWLTVGISDGAQRAN